MADKASKVLKIILNDKRRTKMKVKKIIEKDKVFMLIDGSIVEGNEIYQIVEE